MTLKLDYSDISRSLETLRGMKTGNLRNPLEPAMEGAKFMGDGHLKINENCDEALKNILKKLGYKSNSKAHAAFDKDGNYVINMEKGHKVTLSNNGDITVINNRGMQKLTQPAPIQTPAPKAEPQIDWRFHKKSYPSYRSSLLDLGRFGNIEKLAEDFLARGTFVKNLPDGKKLYRYETAEGVILGKIKDGAVTQLVTPRPKVALNLGSWNYDNKEKRISSSKMIVDFENKTVTEYNHSNWYYPKGNGWKNSTTMEPVKFFGDNEHTSISGRILTNGNKGNALQDYTIRVDKNGEIKDKYLRNCYQEKADSKTIEKIFRHDNVDNKIRLNIGDKQIALSEIKDESGKLIGYSDGIRNYTPEDIVNIIGVPAQWANRVLKTNVKLHP